MRFEAPRFGGCRPCQLTTTLPKSRALLEPEDANRDLCLLQQGDGVEAAK
jgi:hypothetical protein